MTAPASAYLHNMGVRLTPAPAVLAAPGPALALNAPPALAPPLVAEPALFAPDPASCDGSCTPSAAALAEVALAAPLRLLLTSPLFVLLVLHVRGA